MDECSHDGDIVREMDEENFRTIELRREEMQPKGHALLLLDAVSAIPRTLSCLSIEIKIEMFAFCY